MEVLMAIEARGWRFCRMNRSRSRSAGLKKSGDETRMGEADFPEPGVQAVAP